MSKPPRSRWSVWLCAGVAAVAASSGSAQVGLLELPDGPRSDEAPELIGSAAGDVDRDGVPDAVIGRPSDESGFGSLVLISGRTGAELWRQRGTWFEDRLGAHLDAGEDLNGDGIGDVVAVQTVHGPGGGYALCAFSGASGAPLWRVVDAREIFETLRFVGDLDGDGRSELLSGTPFAPSLFVHNGRVALRSGANGALRYELSGAGPLDYLGVAAAPLEDLDADGTRDFAVGAPMGHPPQDPNIGRGYVGIYSGRSGRLLRRIDGPAPSGAFGTALANLGDLDRDGLPELAIGAPHEPPGGAVYFVSTSTGAILRRLGGSAPNALFGSAVARLRDLDGDGSDECAVGAPGDHAGDGAVHLFAGASGALLATIAGTASEHVGTHLAPASDVSGDGAEDLWILVQRPLPLPDLLRLSSPRRVTPFGAGCSSSAAAPVLSLQPLRLGSTTQLLASGAPVFAPGCALFGLRPHLPLVLDARCTLYLDPSTLFGSSELRSDAGGAVALALPVPADPWLAGLSIAAQLGFAESSGGTGFALTQAVYGALAP